MAALTEDRNTPRREGRVLSLPVAGGETIYAGALVALNAGGYAAPGATATGLRGLGRAEARADNSSGADSALSVDVQKGVFRFANDGADPVGRADIGTDCYIVDDQTVARTDGAGTRSVAGRVMDVDAEGVWVAFE
ncbi:MAG: hypothetical protein P8Y66_07670 [Nitrospirota bacterium]|jgi:hypothetical protein